MPRDYNAHEKSRKQRFAAERDAGIMKSAGQEEIERITPTLEKIAIGLLVVSIILLVFGAELYFGAFDRVM